LYNLALSTVGGFIRRKRETGSVSPAKFGGHKTFALVPHTDLVKKLVVNENNQGKSNVLLFPRITETSGDGRVRCRERLGGLLR
jgi:hypothetical protein